MPISWWGRGRRWGLWTVDPVVDGAVAGNGDGDGWLVLRGDGDGEAGDVLHGQGCGRLVREAGLAVEGNNDGSRIDDLGVGGNMGHRWGSNISLET